jgi:hypothetical protein
LCHRAGQEQVAYLWPIPVSDYNTASTAEQAQQLVGGVPQVLILLLDSSFLSCPEDAVATESDDKGLDSVPGHCLFFAGDLLR